MPASSLHELVLPVRFAQSDLADVVLNGASRRELLDAQTSVTRPGTGLRLDHRVAVSLIVDLRDSGWRLGAPAESNKIILKPPRITSRDRQRALLSRWKKKNPQEGKEWLTARAPALLQQVISGPDLQIDRITPVMVPCDQILAQACMDVFEKLTFPVKNQKK